VPPVQKHRQDHSVQALITARSLYKCYGDFTAVDHIDFDVLHGECFGFVGPNGAGKTSTMRMTTCMSPPSGGELLVDGLDVRSDHRRIKARLGVVSQDDNLDGDLTVRENLLVYARYFDISRAVAAPRADEVLALFQLTDKRNEKINALSGGLKRRLTIARALISAPTLLVLDEPTTGLDPQARHLVWRQLRALKDQGMTMVLTSHYMDEAARLCDRLVIMHQGRILVHGTPEALVREHAGNEVIELRPAPGRTNEILAAAAMVEGLQIEDTGDTIYLFCDGPVGSLAMRFEDAADDIFVRRANLEDVFLRLTGRGLLD